MGRGPAPKKVSAGKTSKPAAAAAGVQHRPVSTGGGAPNRVRVTSGGKIQKYVRYAATALGEGGEVALWSAAPNTIEKTISVSEVAKRACEGRVVAVPSLDVLASGLPQLTIVLRVEAPATG